MNNIFETLRSQGINEKLLQDIETFRAKYPVDEKLQKRVNVPMIAYYGKEVFEMAAYALLQGENILSINRNHSICGSIQTAKHMQQGGLAGAGCADNRHKFAFLYT